MSYDEEGKAFFKDTQLAVMNCECVLTCPDKVMERVEEQLGEEREGGGEAKEYREIKNEARVKKELQGDQSRDHSCDFFLRMCSFCRHGKG